MIKGDRIPLAKMMILELTEEEARLVLDLICASQVEERPITPPAAV